MSNPASATSDVLTTKEVAAFLRVHECTVMDYAKSGKLPAVRLGRRWMFNRKVLEELIQSAYVKPGLLTARCKKS